MDRSSDSVNPEFQSELSHLRKHIDALDSQLLQILSDRMKVSVKVGELKKKFDQPIFQPDRMDALSEKFQLKGSALGLSMEFAAEIFEAIHEESVQVQYKVNKQN